MEAPQPQHQPQSAAVAVDERHHVHHSYIWLGSIRAAVAVFFALLVVAASSIAQIIDAVATAGASLSGMPLIPIVLLLALGGFVVIFGLVIGIHALAYKHLWYALGPDELSVYSGIFVKKRAHVPYQRIQTVDQKASLLQRVFGVCDLAIDTAGGANNKAVLIPYLTKATADRVRSELYARKGAAVAGSVPARVADASAPVQGNVLDIGDEAWRSFGGVFSEAGAPVIEPVSYEYRLTNKQLFLTGLANSSGFGAAIVVVLVAIIQVIALVMDLFPDSSNEMMEGTVSSLQSGVVLGGEAFAASAVVILLIALGVIGITIFVWLASVLSTCIRYGGFHARRHGTRIEVERGLLQHQTESLDASRVQSIIIRRPFIRRIFGYCELCLGKVSAQEGGEGSTDSQQSETMSYLVIHPFAKLSAIDGLLAGMIPEMAAIPHTSSKLSPKALRRGLIRRCIWCGAGFWTAISAACMQIVVGWLIPQFDPEVLVAVPYIDAIAVLIYILAAILLVLDIIGSVLWYRGSAFAMNDGFLRVENAGFACVDVAIPRQKIQFGVTRTNPLQRLARTATLQARTAAGVGGTTVQLIDIRSDDAAAWLEWVRPRRVP